MARIKCEINEDSTLVKFGSLQNGDLFIFNGKPYIAMYEIGDEESSVNAFILDEGFPTHFDYNALVTEVKSAVLKLTI